MHVQAIDSAGNESLVAHGPPITTIETDTTAPMVTGVTLGAGYHLQDSVATFTVSFDESVTVTSAPSLVFSVGATTALVATYSGTPGAAANAHTFDYTVVADLSGDIQVTAFHVDASNTIADGAGNALVGTLGTPLPVGGGAIDSVLPTITGVSDDPVAVVSKIWEWSCSETGCLYQWAVNDDPDFVFTSEPYADVTTHTEQGTEGRRYLHLRAKDQAGNLSDAVKVYVDILDTTSPRATGVSVADERAYGAGEEMVFTVTFDEEVEVRGAPKLLLDIGGTQVKADTNVGVLSTTYDFTYTVQDGDNGAISAVGFEADASSNWIVDDTGNLVETSGVSFSFANLYADTQAPEFAGGIVANGHDSWSWSCTSESACVGYRAIINKDAAYEFPPETPFGNEATLQNTLTSSGNEDYYVHVQANDGVGNISTVLRHGPFRFDNEAPTLVSIAVVSDSSRDTSFAKAGDEVRLTLTFSEDVVITAGAPDLQVSIGDAASSGTPVEASFDGDMSSGTAAPTHDFTYTILDGQNGLLWATGVVLNSAQIQDESGNPWGREEFPLAAAGVTVDTQLPVVNIILDSVSGSSWQWSCAGGESCEYRNLVDKVSTTDKLDDDWNDVTQAANLGEGDTTYYVHVQAIDAAGNESLVTHGPAITTPASDTEAPQVVSVAIGAGYHVQDSVVQFTVSFNEQVTVTGAPDLVFSVGSTADLTAAFSGTEGDTSNIHTFDYTVAADLSGDIAVTGFDLSVSDSIEDGASNSLASTLGTPVAVGGGAIDSVLPTISGVEDDDTPTDVKVWTWSCSETGCLYQWVVNDDPDFAFTSEPFADVTTHTEQGTEGMRYLHLRAQDPAGNLSDAIKVSVDILDTTPPRVTEVSVADERLYRSGEDMVFTVTFDEEVEVRGAPKLLLDIGGSAAKADTNVGALNTTHEFTYTVQDGDNGAVSVVGMEADEMTNSIVDDTNNSLETAGISFTFSDLQVDTQVPEVAILNGTDEDINDDNVNAYLVRGSCSEPGELVISLNDTPLPAQSIACASDAWAVTISTADVGLGSVEITATLTDAAGNVGATAAGVTVNKDITIPYAFYRQSSLSLGYYHSCVVRGQGDVRCWGANNVPNLLGNQGLQSLTAISPLENGMPLEGIVLVSAGSLNTCVLTQEGKVKCLGRGYLLGTGSGSSNAQNTFSYVKDQAGSGELSNIVQVASSDKHVCALDAMGTIWCWGQVFSGILGHVAAANTYRPRPVQMGPTSDPTPVTEIVQIGLGLNHNCGVTRTGGVKCWGNLRFGALGNGQNLTYSSLAVDVLAMSGESGNLSGIVQVEAGDQSSCALTRGGEVRCWGYGNNRVLGNNNNGQHSSRPVAVRAVSGSGNLQGVVKIAMGRSHACALQNTGRVVCWGGGGNGALGNNNTASQALPVEVLDGATRLPLEGVVDMATGGDINHTCVLKHTGEVLCWGRGYSGQLGDGDTSNRSMATLVQESGRSFVSSAPDRGYVCGEVSQGCVLDDFTLSPGANLAAVAEGSGVVRVKGLDSGQTVSFYEDSACTLSKGSTSGAADQEVSFSGYIYPARDLYFERTGTGIHIDCTRVLSTHARWQAPQVERIENLSGSQYYDVGETITLRVHFSEEVTLTGTPKLTIGIAGNSLTAQAALTGTPGGAAISYDFSYEVASDFAGIQGELFATELIGDGGSLSIADVHGIPWIPWLGQFDLDFFIDAKDPVVSIASAPTLIGSAYGAHNPVLVRGDCSYGDEAVEVSLYNESAPETVVSPMGGDAPCTGYEGNGQWLARFDPSSLGDGTLVVKAAQRDAAGHEVVDTAELTKDFQVPTLTLNVPAAITGATDLGSYVLSGTCGGGNGAIGLTLRDSGGNEIDATSNCPTAGTWSKTIDVTSLVEGTVVISALYEDTAKNRGIVEPVEIVKDTRAPAVSLSVLNIIYHSSAASYALSGSCSEIGAEVTVALTSDGTGDVGESSLTPTAPTCADDGTWGLSGFGAENLKNGNIEIVISQVDSGQNSGELRADTIKTGSTVGFTINVAPPINGDNAESYTLEGTYFPLEGTLTMTMGGVIPNAIFSNLGWNLECGF